jgi:chromosome segregation protein
VEGAGAAATVTAMYIKRLRMAGFKSFADPTVLEFEPGVNVIVGPNGSGKSNIADALSWVLGSQAPSSLRSGSMEDVIFAGSEGRSRLGIAEVELTLDNASRVLPLDLNEVTISRIADRSGESEYRINGAPCRLLDVAELLSDTGIGRSIHTVVGQGQLDAVLQARPEERRTFIEEAAQIGKYRRRKDRALKRIERVDDNLIRLEDILGELRRSVRPLKRQATAAAAYSEMLGEQRTLRQRLAATDLKRLRSDDVRFDPDTEARRAGLLGDEIASIRARLESASESRERLVAAADKASDTAHGTARATDKLAALSRLAQERAEKISARLAAETEEGYRERIRLLDTERMRWTGELSRLEEEAQRLAHAASDARSSLDERNAEMSSAETRLARARADETAAAQALVRAEGSEAAGRATLGSIEARVHAVVECRTVTESEIAEAAHGIGKAEEEVRAIEGGLDARTEQAAAAEERYDYAAAARDRLKERLNDSRLGRAAAQARVETLREVLELFAGEPGVQKRIRPLLDAAAAAAGDSLGAEEAARDELRSAQADAERLGAEVDLHDRELRRLDALMSGAAERLGGARRRHETREIELAALDEELARAQESLAAAQRASVEERAALPARRAALEEAQREREGAEEVARGVAVAVAEATSGATAAEMEARSAQERSLAAQLRLEEAHAGIADAEAALAGLEDVRARLGAARDAAHAVARTAALAAQTGLRWTGRAEANSAAARAEADAGDRRLASLRGRERDLTEQLDHVARRRNEAEVHRAENRARMEAIGERAMEDWGLSLGDLDAVESLEDEDEAAARERVEKLDRDLRRLGPINPHAAEEYSELSERESFLVGQIEDLKRSKRDLLKVVHEVNDTIVQVFDEAYSAVAGEFEAVFWRLFPGGSGRLKLIDPDNMLLSGIDVEAQPPGKNVRKLSLLSGGERSLVALAFLFAIFRARPSPFYLLDEVEAALDDINLQRFLGLIAELEERAQVLIVTHQKRTMEAADVLYGVSMRSDGVSLVVAKRMERFEQFST